MCIVIISLQAEETGAQKASADVAFSATGDLERNYTAPRKLHLARERNKVRIHAGNLSTASTNDTNGSLLLTKACNKVKVFP